MVMHYSNIPIHSLPFPLCTPKKSIYKTTPLSNNPKDPSFLTKRLSYALPTSLPTPLCLSLPLLHRHSARKRSARTSVLMLPSCASAVNGCAFFAGYDGCVCDADGEEGGECGEVGFWDSGHGCVVWVCGCGIGLVQYRVGDIVVGWFDVEVLVMDLVLSIR
jgi:hypothetical protein